MGPIVHPMARSRVRKTLVRRIHGDIFSRGVELIRNLTEERFEVDASIPLRRVASSIGMEEETRMTARGKTRRSRSINFHRRGCTRAGLVCTLPSLLLLLLLLASLRHETDGAYTGPMNPPGDGRRRRRRRRKVFPERKE